MTQIVILVCMVAVNLHGCIVCLGHFIVSSNCSFIYVSIPVWKQDFVLIVLLSLRLAVCDNCHRMGWSRIEYLSRIWWNPCACHFPDS